MKPRNRITRESDLAGVSNGGFGTFAAASAPIDSDKGGMPDAYESALGWNPATQDHNTAVTGTTFFPAGYPGAYTRLEEYLHFKSVPHLLLQKNTTTSPDIDLTRHAAGFSNNPVFTIANVTGGTATQSGAGNHLHRETQRHPGRRRVADIGNGGWRNRRHRELYRPVLVRESLLSGGQREHQGPLGRATRHGDKGHAR